MPWRRPPHDEDQEKDRVRVVDESGDGYLYPETMFEPIQVPDRAVKALELVS